MVEPEAGSEVRDREKCVDKLMRNLKHGILLIGKMPPGQHNVCSNGSLLIGAPSLRRSGKVGKVRERGPDSRGVLFGRLVAEYMRVHGLTNQDVALKVYNDEERKSSVSDVLSGRSDPRPETIARYRDALAIPQGAIENIFSVDRNEGFEKIEGDIAALARARHADQ